MTELWYADKSIRWCCDVQSSGTSIFSKEFHWLNPEGIWSVSSLLSKVLAWELAKTILKSWFLKSLLYWCLSKHRSLITTFSIHLAKPAGCWSQGFLGLLLMLSLLKIIITFPLLHSQFEYLVTDHLVCLCTSSVDFLLTCSFEHVDEYQLVLMPHRRHLF